MNAKGIIITIVATFGIIGLMMWMTGGKQSNIANNLGMYKDTNVACLTNGHASLAGHIHPTLTITADGEQEVIPANIGISSTCMPEVHTHDETGQIHVESVVADRMDNFSLVDFFAVWEQPIERPGYDVAFFLNGEEKASAEEVPFVDQSNIEVVYTSNGESKETTETVETGNATFQLSTEVEQQ
jgi:hypothetical protein